MEHTQNSSNPAKRRSLMAGACVASAMLAGSLSAGAATIIPLNNFSFADFDTSTNPRAFTGWSGGTAYDDYSNASLDSSVGTGGDGAVYITVGVGGGTNNALIQNSSYLAVLGETYRFTIGIGNRTSFSGEDTAGDYVGTISLLIGGASMASNLLANTGTPPDGGWANAFVEYTAVAADVGQLVGVQIGAVSSRRQFDNARLEAIPEPSAFALVGGAAILGLVRRRRNS